MRKYTLAATEQAVTEKRREIRACKEQLERDHPTLNTDLNLRGAFYGAVEGILDQKAKTDIGNAQKSELARLTIHEAFYSAVRDGRYNEMLDTVLNDLTKQNDNRINGIENLVSLVIAGNNRLIEKESFWRFPKLSRQ